MLPPGANSVPVSDYADRQWRRSFLVVEVPDASNKRCVPVLFRPLDCLVLRLERGKYMVGMIFHHVVIDWIALMPTFWTRFNTFAMTVLPSLSINLPWRARPIGPKGLVEGMPCALRSRYACSMMPQGNRSTPFPLTCGGLL